MKHPNEAPDAAGFQLGPNMRAARALGSKDRGLSRGKVKQLLEMLVLHAVQLLGVERGLDLRWTA